MSNVIINPEQVPKKYSSWTKLYREAKKNNLLDNPSFLIAFHEPIDSRINYESITVKIHRYEIFVSYLKQKCFDEIEAKEPEDLSVDICHQLLHLSNIAELNFKMPVAEWLKKFTNQQLDILYTQIENH